MDKATLAAYDRDANGFASDWETQPPPSDLHATVKRFFIPGGRTADIGCGSGRDAAWLDMNGYHAKGFDASDGLLSEARRRYPQVEFSTATLPCRTLPASRKAASPMSFARQSLCISNPRRSHRPLKGCCSSWPVVASCI